MWFCPGFELEHFPSSANYAQIKQVHKYKYTNQIIPQYIEQEQDKNIKKINLTNVSEL